MDPAADALRRINTRIDRLEEVVDRLLDAWQKAKPVEPAPVPKPEPAHTGWITDRVPEDGDGDRQGNVQVPPRDGGRGVCIVHYLGVYPGTPWTPIGPNPGPWDPHTFDRNGWIRSRLPTATDTGYAGQVLIPAGEGYETANIHHLLIVPGQPWAPWASGPSSYQP